jgi:prolyl oligopeptidase
MSVSRFIIMSLFLIACNESNKKSYKYPSIRISKNTEIHHGVEISDNYRFLENLNDPEVIDWFKSQSNFTDSIMNRLSKTQYLYDKMSAYEEKQNGSISKFSYQKDGSFFYIEQKQLDSPGKLNYRQSENAKERLIFDPSTYEKNHFINEFKASWDLSKIVISVSATGSDRSNLIIYDLETKQILPPVITNSNPSLVGKITWLPDSSGFIYVYIPHFDFKNISYLNNTKAVLYSIGTPPNVFQEVFSKEHNPTIPFKKEDYPIISILSKDSKYVFGTIGGVSDFKDTYYSPISNNGDYSNLKWKLLFSKDQKIAQFDVHGTYLIYRTAKNASSFKICRTSILNPDFENAEVLVEEKQNEVINSFKHTERKLFFSTIKNGVSAKFFVKSENIESEIGLPFASGNARLLQNAENPILSIGGWTRPNSIFRYDSAKEKFIDLTPTDNNFKEFNDFIVEEIEIPSHDNVLIPVSLIYKKGLSKNGKNNTLLLNYGAYGLSFSPYFSIPFLTWVSEGGIWVIPHIRGGGEKGDAWHKAGYKTTKPNTWKDVIACAEYLIAEKYTSSDHIVNYGASAGGIAVGRSITERPDLFAVGAMAVPSLNLLRSELQPNGPNNIKEFGTVKNKTEFMALLEMDSYHHIEKDVNYPAIIINIGMNDGIVTPWDSAKFIARMQNSKSVGKPVLLSVTYDTGHHVDGNMRGYFKDISEIFAFSLWQTGESGYQIK